MLVGVTKLIQGPKMPIPSFVWFGFEHDVEDRFRYLIARSFLAISRNTPRRSPYPLDSISERKMRATSILSIGNGAGISGMVQGRPEGIQNVKHNSRNRAWRLFEEFDFYNLLSGLTVQLGDQFAGFCFNESVDDALQLTNTSLCMVDETL